MNIILNIIGGFLIGAFYVKYTSQKNNKPSGITNKLFGYTYIRKNIELNPELYISVSKKVNCIRSEKVYYDYKVRFYEHDKFKYEWKGSSFDNSWYDSSLDDIIGDSTKCYTQLFENPIKYQTSEEMNAELESLDLELNKLRKELHYKKELV